MLRRSLGHVAPVSASLPDGGHAELIYPHRRETRTWPTFELLDTAPAERAGPSASEPPESKSAVGAPAEGDLAAELAAILGGSVSSVSAGPSGRAAALWTAEPFPPWYHVVSYARSGRVMTPETVRVSGAPCWSQTGELAAGAFDGIRRGIVLIDPGDGAARWWSRPASASYRLLALGPGGGDALAIRADDDGSARLVRARPGGADEPLQLLRAGDQARVQVVTWTDEGVALEGLLALPRAAGPARRPAPIPSWCSCTVGRSARWPVVSTPTCPPGPPQAGRCSCPTSGLPASRAATRCGAPSAVAASRARIRRSAMCCPAWTCSPPGDWPTQAR